MDSLDSQVGLQASTLVRDVFGFRPTTDDEIFASGLFALITADILSRKHYCSYEATGAIAILSVAGDLISPLEDPEEAGELVLAVTTTFNDLCKTNPRLVESAGIYISRFLAANDTPEDWRKLQGIYEILRENLSSN